MRTRRLFQTMLSVLALLTLTAPLSFVACRQGEGERCQIQSDCQEPLYCELKGQDPSQGGTCRTRTTDDAGQSVDQASAADQAPAADMTSSSDLGDGGQADMAK